MLYKIALVSLFSVLILHSGVLSVSQLDSQDNLLLERLLQVRESRDVAQTRDLPLARADDIVTSLINLVINAVLGIVIAAACGVISPYLTVIKLFQSTVLAGLVLIVNFAADLAATYFTDLTAGIDTVSTGITWLNETITNATTYISTAGCSA